MYVTVAFPEILSTPVLAGAAAFPRRAGQEGAVVAINRLFVGAQAAAAASVLAHHLKREIPPDWRAEWNCFRAVMYSKALRFLFVCVPQATKKEE
jgi:hypothetical protein